MNIEIIRNTLYKAYLEAFYNFCKELGGTTADVMCEILAVGSPFLLKMQFAEYPLTDNGNFHFSLKLIGEQSLSPSTLSEPNFRKTIAPNCTLAAESSTPTV